MPRGGHLVTRDPGSSEGALQISKKGPALVWGEQALDFVFEASLDNGDPAQNHGHDTTRQPYEEHDFDSFYR
jgi:hypothetical protein